MDRQDRIPILEPLLLILKQRTGIAVVLMFIASFGGHVAGLDNELIVALNVGIMTYIGGQKYVDSKEAASKVQDKVDKIVDTLES